MKTIRAAIEIAQAQEISVRSHAKLRQTLGMGSLFGRGLFDERSG